MKHKKCVCSFFQSLHDTQAALVATSLNYHNVAIVACGNYAMIKNFTMQFDS